MSHKFKVAVFTNRSPPNFASNISEFTQIYASNLRELIHFYFH